MSFELSGKIVEHDLFGTPERGPKQPDYLPYKAAMELVRKLQPGDPKDPKTLFAYHVYIETERALQLDADASPLSFYTAVDSVLDYKHGVDGWFELDGGPVRATIDLTTNPHKDRAKADILFTVPSGGYANEEEIQAAALSLAQEVASRLRGADLTH
jgi:hypothetical protein